MEANARGGERNASYSKLNDWNQANNTKVPFTARSTNLSRWKFIFVVLTIASCIVFIGLGIGFGITKIHQKGLLRPFHLSGTDVFREAAVASQTPICSEAGKDILLKGGSAVDAAIAALLCEGVNSPQSAGLGGGFFMTVFKKSDGTVSVIDARETAPRNATRDMFRFKGTSSRTGGLAVAVPGEIRGYELAHKRFGNLNWTDLFVPAIRMCRQGVSVTRQTASTLKNRVAELIYAEPSMSVFLNKNTGELLKEDDVVTYPDLARTLEIIATKGADELYTGKLAEDLVADLQKFGGIITVQDLADYKALEREPVFVTLKDDVTVYSVPAPGSGTALSLLLSMLDRFNFNSSSTDTEEKETLVYHRFVEACKFAYAKRTNLGDPDFKEGATEAFVEVPSIKEMTDEIMLLMNDQRTFEPKHYGDVFAFKPDHGTTHVSVVAPNGDAVSVTSTINTWFGASIRSNSTGILFNNEMDDFSTPDQENFYRFPPSPNNFIAPQKRAASSMSPSIALDGNRNFLYSFGASGGSKIITTNAFVFMAHHFFGMGVEDAIKLNRVHHQLLPNAVEYENDVPQYVLEGLKLKGHDLKPVDLISAMYLISRGTEGELYASSDPRRQGHPSGF